MACNKPNWCGDKKKNTFKIVFGILENENILAKVFVALKMEIYLFFIDLSQFFCYNDCRSLKTYIFERWNVFNRNFPLFTVENILLLKRFNQRIETAYPTFYI